MRPGFNPWVGKIPWRRKGQPTPVFLPGESHGQRSLAGYSPQGREQLDTTEETWHMETYIKTSWLKANSSLMVQISLKKSKNTETKIKLILNYKFANDNKAQMD